MPAPSSRAVINSSASHVFEVLRFVAEAEEPMGVTEISRLMALPASTVYRALVTLEEAGYLSRYQNTPRYEVGQMPQLLNRALFNRFHLHKASRPVLRTLAHAIGETVSLSVRLGWFGLRIGGAYGSNDIYHRDRLGEAVLLHDGLAAPAILAGLPAEERAGYRRFVTAHYPDRVPADGWDALESRLAAAVADGFVAQPIALAPGFQAAALPIRAGDGIALAAITANGPVLRPGELALPAALLAARDQLEAMVRAEPDLYRSPFQHIAADDIRLHLP
ncbi:IclR family transcriptional regulator [Niveispirillum fermenti]|uniref:IclR family transcriptional regulator n=1 Tax=Niveispirillum fermenti TaxID=1233113 RepID=UPI003A862DD3